MSTAPAQPPRLGKYLLLKKLGGGGMGRVYLASLAGPMDFEKKVVVKTILPAFTQNKDYVQLFLNEARLGARLSHSAVAQIQELGEENGLYYLVMEYVDGWTLRQAIKAAQKAGTTLSPARVAEIMARACEGLYYAHTLLDKDGRPLGVVHRDLSPQNIMISRQGDVKVIDFGVARSDLSTNETVAGTIKGKLAYMSPEQARGERVDSRSDIFALGVMLYEALTNRNPFDLDSPVSILRAIENLEPPTLKGISADLGPFDPIIRRCLQKDRERRYPDARELRMDLLAVLERARASKHDHLGSWVVGVLEGHDSGQGVEERAAQEARADRTSVEPIDPFSGPKDPGLALDDPPEEDEQATRIKTMEEPRPAAVAPRSRTRSWQAEAESPDDFADPVSHVSGLRKGPPWVLLGALAAALVIGVGWFALRERLQAPPLEPARPAVAAMVPSAPAAAPPATPPTVAVATPAPSELAPIAVPPVPAPPAAAEQAKAPEPASAIAKAEAPAESVVPPPPTEQRRIEPAAEVATETPEARPTRGRRKGAVAVAEPAIQAPPVVMAEALAEQLIVRPLGETLALDSDGIPVTAHRPLPAETRLKVGNMQVDLKESSSGGHRTLSIHSQPWALASIDGVSHGKTPLSALPLPSRGLRLELIRPGMDAPAVLQVRPAGQ